MASDGILDYAAADALEFCVEAAHYHNADTIYAVKVTTDLLTDNKRTTSILLTVKIIINFIP